MRFVVVGGGGIGSVVAGHLARAGHDVTLVTRGAHLRAIQERGLEVCGRTSFRTAVDAAETATGTCDALVLATKTFDTATALGTVSCLRPRVALSLQNGLVKNRQLAQMFGWEQVIGATTMIGGERLAPGIVSWTLDGTTVVGELDGPVTPRVEELAAAWNASDLTMQVADDVVAHEWAKQAIQAGISPLSVMSNLPIHLVLSTRPLAEALVEMIRETAAVAATLGVEVSDSEAYAFDVRAITREHPNCAVERVLSAGEALIAAGKTGTIVSMLQDVRAGRQTEVEETVGHVVREGTRLGVPVPFLTLACAVVRGIEARYAEQTASGRFETCPGSRRGTRTPDPSYE